MSKWRNLVCWPLLVVFSVSSFGEDTGAAILRSHGNVMVNRIPALPAVALSADDLIETGDGLARIQATGTAVDLDSRTMVQFEGNEIFLDHGSLSVNTSRGLRVRIGCMTVIPVNAAQTHYEISDVDGRILVRAIANDVNIDSRSSKGQPASQAGHAEHVTVREGEEKSGEEKCGVAPVTSSGGVSAIGAILNSVGARIAGVAAVGALTCWALCRSGAPISPHRPQSD